ncbi:uncharacterized protein BKA78DRAFT_160277 [Phyllosticta capitalensis]|uniref:uncharacterized protein n=1 Tax=Phyllosticta capitalensis TaxID=121624 RepID=UPI00312D8FD3
MLSNPPSPVLAFSSLFAFSLFASGMAAAPRQGAWASVMPLCLSIFWLIGLVGVERIYGRCGCCRSCYGEMEGWLAGWPATTTVPCCCDVRRAACRHCQLVSTEQRPR